MKRFLLFLLCGLILLTVPGCSGKDSSAIADDQQTAEDFVRSMGCTIITKEGETSRYILDREMLKEYYNMQLWGVQTEDPETYLGKEIVTYDFIVSGHPLEKKYASIYKENNYDTAVMVMIVNGKVIGGGSTPKSKNKLLILAGGYYALNGDDLETVKGLNYAEWLDVWTKKYRQ
jgi:hypothetical protein